MQRPALPGVNIHAASPGEDDDGATEDGRSQLPRFAVGDLVEVGYHSVSVNGAEKTHFGGVGHVTRVQAQQQLRRDSQDTCDGTTIGAIEATTSAESAVPEKAAPGTGIDKSPLLFQYDVRYVVRERQGAGANRGATEVADMWLTPVLSLKCSTGDIRSKEVPLAAEDLFEDGNRGLRSNTSAGRFIAKDLVDASHAVIAHTATAVRAALNSRAFAAIAAVERSIMRLPGGGGSGGGLDGGVQKLTAAVNAAARKRDLCDLQAAAEQLSDYCFAATIALNMA